MIPWRVALALQADGWYLRSVIVWAKKSPMPESVTDRPTSSWEPIFLLAKGERYFMDMEAVREQVKENSGQNMRAPKLGDHRADGNYDTVTEKTYDRVCGANQRNVWHLGPEPFNMSGETVHWQPVEVGASGDDIRRTPSAGCPVHDRPGSRSCGEHEGDASSRSLGTCAHPAQEPLREPGCIATIHDQPSPACGTGSPDPVRSQTATSRSSQSRRTARVPSTTRPCTPSAQTLGGTSGTSGELVTTDSAGHTTASRTSADDVRDASGSDPSGQTMMSSGGICTCQYHRRTTKKIDHFATFPTEIPRRAIKAGTSEKGACPECGAPWVRVVERKSSSPNQRVGYTQNCTGRNDGERPGSFTDHESRTTGWQPTCKCGNPNTVPCVVLDPFLGSGTTIAVARTLGRHGVGCELNPAYAELARERIGKAEKPSTFVSAKAEESPLFLGATK
jgi:hypothetical protein